MDKRMVRHSLVFKISICIVSVFIVVSTFVFIVNYNMSRDALVADVEDEINNRADYIQSRIYAEITSVMQASKDMSSVVTNSTLTGSGLIAVAGNILNKSDVLTGIAISYEPYMFSKDISYLSMRISKTADGIRTIRQGENSGYFKSSWYDDVKKSGNTIWIGPYYDKAGREGDIPIVTCTMPMYKDVDGRKVFVGVFSCDASLNWLFSLISETKVYKTGYAFLLSSNGTILAAKDKDSTVREAVGSILGKSGGMVNGQLKDNTIIGQKGLRKFFNSSTGEQSYLYFVPFSTSDWTVGIIVPEKEVFYELWTTSAALSVVGIAGYLIMMALIVFLMNKITSPLRKLSEATNEIGEGNFSSSIPLINSKDEIGVLSHSFLNMQSNLVKYVDNLKEATSAREKIEKELAIAREIQNSILPHRYPEHGQIDISGFLEPAREVGGDLYDFVFIDNDRFCFSIGDVAGKGVPAALFMAVARTLFRSSLKTFKSPAAILNAMNEELQRDNDASMFVTFFIGVLNIRTGLLEYANAGHNPPLLGSGSVDCSFLEYSNSPPLGLVITEHSYSNSSIRLNQGSTLFLYTDGVTEAEDREYRQFTDQKLKETVSMCINKDAGTIVKTVTAAVNDFVSGAPQSDDITMLAVRYLGNKAAESEAV